MLLTLKEKNNLDKLGHVVLKNRISQDSILKGREAFKRMLEKCEKRKYLFVRSFNGNVFNQIIGIEHLFHPDIFEPVIFHLMQESLAAELSREILGEDNVSLILNRLICNQKYSFNGSWHRDGTPSLFEHVQFAIPLYHEDGFLVISGSHKIEDNALEFDWHKSYPSSKILKNQEHISISPRDVLIFHSSILHRGTCKGYSPFERAQIHLRISGIPFAQKDYTRCKEEEESMNRKEVLNLANNTWRKIITQKLDNSCRFRNYAKFKKCKFITRKGYEFLYYVSKYFPQCLGSMYLPCKYIR